MTEQHHKILIFLLIFIWLFSGWSTILSFAREAPPTLQKATSTSQSEVTQGKVVEEKTQQISVPPQPQLPPLKERQLQKEVQLDKNSRHFCGAKSFIVDLSGRSQSIVELELNGMRGDAEDLEVGSLPLGIDITFLKNAGYEYRPQQSDNNAVLQITNQPGSQKGNFSVPVIYQSGNLTTICQINIINF